MPHHACGDQGMCVGAGSLSSSDSLPCPAFPTRLFCDFIIHFSDSFACHLALATKGRWERKCTLSTLKEPVSVSGSSFLGAFVTAVCFNCHLCPSTLLTSPAVPATSALTGQRGGHFSQMPTDIFLMLTACWVTNWPFGHSLDLYLWGPILLVTEN